MAFPVNVPNVPGVPAVISVPGVSDVVSLLTQDALSLFAGVANLPWGIYLGPVPVVLADTVIAFDYRQQFEISSFPVEGGEFQDYNKVYRPFEVRFRFAAGNLANQQKLLDILDAVIADTNLYNVVTAAAVYIGVNLTGKSYQQAANNGLGLLAVDVTAEQVKTASSALLFNVLDPSSSAQANGGTVQATAPSQPLSGILGSIF